MGSGLWYGFLLATACLALGGLSSPLDQQLEERAAEACTFPYVNEQLRYCPTATPFCSSFLRHFPPVATSTKVSKRVSTVRTTKTVTTGETPFSTVTYAGPTSSSCDGVAKRAADPEAQPARPTAFGPSCNVHLIEPTKVEAGCNCIITYTGKRPKPTTTVTVTSTSVSRSTTVIITSVPVPTVTIVQFKMKAHYPDGRISPFIRALVLIGGDYDYYIEPGFDMNSPGDDFSLNLFNSTLELYKIGSRTKIGVVDSRMSNRLDQVRSNTLAETTLLKPVKCRMNACGKLNCFYAGDAAPMFFFVCPENADAMSGILAGAHAATNYTNFPPGCELATLYAAAG